MKAQNVSQHYGQIQSLNMHNFFIHKKNIIIRMPNAIAVNIEEFHSLLLEKIELITDIPFVVRERGIASDRF